MDERIGLKRKRKKDGPGMILREPSMAEPTANLTISARIWLNEWRRETFDTAVAIPATSVF